MARRAMPVEPHATKRAFAALIDAQCRRLGFVDAVGRPDRRRLSAYCGLAPTTLNLVIRRPGRPGTHTLIALEDRTGVPVDRWLEALGLLARSDVQPETLTSAERRLLEFARGQGEAWVLRTVEWLEGLAGGGGAVAGGAAEHSVHDSDRAGTLSPAHHEQNDAILRGHGR